ncbi:Tn3 transposase DDE domain protein [Streptomyces sp. ADI97-07]|nr:Tn3 transposase DDE domain protein [Streptomyces sp. ADI97-07]
MLATNCCAGTSQRGPGGACLCRAGRTTWLFSSSAVHCGRSVQALVVPGGTRQYVLRAAGPCLRGRLQGEALDECRPPNRVTRTASRSWPAGARRAWVRLLYAAFREVGWAIRTIQFLRYLSDASLSRRVTAATNRVESFNRFSQPIGFGNAEPALALGFGDAGEEVVADLGESVALGGVGPEHRAADAGRHRGVPKARPVPRRRPCASWTRTGPSCATGNPVQTTGPIPRSTVGNSVTCCSAYRRPVGAGRDAGGAGAPGCRTGPLRGRAAGDLRPCGRRGRRPVPDPPGGLVGDTALDRCHLCRDLPRRHRHPPPRPRPADRQWFRSCVRREPRACRPAQQRRPRQGVRPVPRTAGLTHEPGPGRRRGYAIDPAGSVRRLGRSCPRPPPPRHSFRPPPPLRPARVPHLDPRPGGDATG